MNNNDGNNKETRVIIKGEERQAELFDNKALNISVRVLQMEDGSILINADDAARSVNMIKCDYANKKGVYRIRWNRFNEYLKRDGYKREVKSGDYIPEGMFYSIVMNSQSPMGKKVRNWIAQEVIPTVRKHGAYMTKSTLDKALEDPSFAIGLLTNLKEEREKNKMLKEKVEELEVIEGYYNEVLAPANLITSTEISNDLGMSVNKFHEVLNKLGVIYKVNNSWVVYSKYQGLAGTHYDYVCGGGQTLRWTEKGREWFIKDILKLV